jgi:hypothetical protein
MGDPFPAFDLNVCLEEDDDGNLPFDLNNPILEDHNNNGKHQRQIITTMYSVCLFFFFYIQSNNV